MEEEQKPEIKENRKEVFRYSQLGTDFVANVLVGLLLGYLLDRLFSIYPWGLISGLIIGTFAAFWQIYKFVVREELKEKGKYEK